ncbi:hypothetical protein AVEN_40789-1 [Araneus ventricosus]|uniref:Uncharacterized protein n=1 Tax=Araneus ventricosus TaxID=182803 RepID=A0A4Y2CEL3_ARAVE|nr:hypothetical protein AVEN_40789-1 [Araneus ventricosus]
MTFIAFLETMKDFASFIEDTGLGVNGVASSEYLAHHKTEIVRYYGDGRKCHWSSESHDDGLAVAEEPFNICTPLPPTEPMRKVAICHNQLQEHLYDSRAVLSNFFFPPPTP